MNKKELVNAMAAKTDTSGAAADRAVNALVEIISDALKNGDSLTLPGFGTFEVRERAARTGRNPKTGEELKIAASRVPAFKPGADAKGCGQRGRKVRTGDKALSVSGALAYMSLPFRRSSLFFSFPLSLPSSPPLYLLPPLASAPYCPLPGTADDGPPLSPSLSLFHSPFLSRPPPFPHPGHLLA